MDVYVYMGQTMNLAKKSKSFNQADLDILWEIGPRTLKQKFITAIPSKTLQTMRNADINIWTDNMDDTNNE